MTLPNGGMGWSVVCDSGISWSYSITFCVLEFKGPLTCEVNTCFLIKKNSVEGRYQKDTLCTHIKGSTQTISSIESGHSLSKEFVLSPF